MQTVKEELPFNEETSRLATQLAELTGEPLPRAVARALQERLDREKKRRNRAGVSSALLKIAQRCASRPLLDNRSPEEILGYDEHGLPS
jgi:antitoxin VapB